MRLKRLRKRFHSMSEYIFYFILLFYSVLPSSLGVRAILILLAVFSGLCESLFRGSFGHAADDITAASLLYYSYLTAASQPLRADQVK